MSDKLGWGGWAGVGAIAGVAAVIVALFAWLLPFQPAQTAESTTTTKSATTNLPQTTTIPTTTTTTVVPSSVPEHVTHTLNRVISDKHMLRVTLSSMEVNAQVIKANLVYQNYGAESYGLSCAEENQDLTGTYLYYKMQRITATNSYCFSNPGVELELQPGESMASWAEYPNALPATGEPFSFHWYDLGNVVEIQF